MKELIGMLGQRDITSCDMRKVVMQTEEPDSKIEAMCVLLATGQGVCKNYEVAEVQPWTVTRTVPRFHR